MGVDLLELYRGRLSYRRVCVIVSCLDENSLLFKELIRREMGEKMKWGPTDHLLTALVNTERYHVYLQEIKMWHESGKKGTKPHLPAPIYPPGYQPEKKFATTKEIAQLFGQF